MAGLGRRRWVQGWKQGLLFPEELAKSVHLLLLSQSQQWEGGHGIGAANVGEPWGDREEEIWCGKDVMAAGAEISGPGKRWL